MDDRELGALGAKMEALEKAVTALSLDVRSLIETRAYQRGFKGAIAALAGFCGAIGAGLIELFLYWKGAK